MNKRAVEIKKKGNEGLNMSAEKRRYKEKETNVIGMTSAIISNELWS